MGGEIGDAALSQHQILAFFLPDLEEAEKPGLGGVELRNHVELSLYLLPNCF